MKILHICNDFSYTRVHSNLYRALDRNGVNQVIFHPLREEKNRGKNFEDFPFKKSKILYSELLKGYHRFLFRFKVKFLYSNLSKQIDFKTLDFIHATTLFSDGTIAYKIWCKYKTPYIVTVRNTDVEVFLKFRPDLVFLANKILKNASKVVFISGSDYKKLISKIIIRPFLSSFINKSEIINNGIDDYWLNNVTEKEIKEPKNLLYIGSFLKRKNVLKLIEVFEEISFKKPNLFLNLVGGYGEDLEEVVKISKQNSQINYLGVISDKKELLKIYRSSDIFTMVSHRETFGLVYLEAMSQGLPVLYSKNQGISEDFPSNIGEKVDPFSKDDIKQGLLNLLANYKDYNLNEIDFEKFRWSKIADHYLKIYDSNK